MNTHHVATAVSVLAFCLTQSVLAAEQSGPSAQLNRYVQMHTGYLHLVRAAGADGAADGTAGSLRFTTEPQAAQRDAIGGGSASAVGTFGAPAAKRF